MSISVSKRKPRFAAAAAAILLITTLIMPLPAKALSRRIVRVGYYPMENYHAKDVVGNVVGYEVDYLNRIAEKANWEIEFIEASSWNNAVEMLERGIVDIVSPGQIMPDRLARFGFSALPIGKVYGAVMTLRANTRFVYEDFDAFSNMTFGIESGVSYNSLFEEYAKGNGFTPKKVKAYENHEALIYALNAGHVDAIIANIMRTEDNMKLLARFGTSGYYFMFRKDDTDLEDALNDALYQIDLESPSFQNDLTQRYFPIYTEENLTKEEVDYVKTLRPLRVACPSNMDPVSYTDPVTGEPAGITHDILQIVAKKTGLAFTYVPLPSGDVTYDYLRSQRIDLVSCVEQNGTNANSPGVRLTSPYFQSRKVIVGKRGVAYDKDAKLTIAVSTGSQTLTTILNAQYPGYTVARYLDNSDCMDAILKGKADIMIQNHYIVQPILAKPQYEELAVIPSQGIADNLCLTPVIYQEKAGEENAFLSDERLMSVLNKGIANVSADESSAILIAHTTDRPYPFSFSDFAYKYRFAIGIFTVSAICLSLFAAYAIQLKRKNFWLLHDSEKKLRSITNNINGGVVVLLPNEGMKITYANEGFLNLIECGPSDYADVMNASYIMYVHKQDEAVINNMAKRSSSEGEKISTRLRIRKKDGGYVPTRFNGTMTRNERGEVEMYCVIMDISQEVEIQNRLEFEQRKHDLLIEKANEVIYEIDMKKNEAHFSEAFGRIFGWIPETQCPDFSKWLCTWKVSQKDIPALQELARRTLECQEDASCSVRLRSAGGRYIWCSIVQYAMQDKRGETKLILGKIADVDEEIRRRQMLEKKSQTDIMTGLYNKEAFIKLAGQYLEESGDENAALIFLDLDHFKDVNDRLGHITGDTAIQDTAKKLRVLFSGYDLLARFGGDEFCILVKEIPKKTLEDKLRWALEKLCQTYSDGAKEVTVTASIGVVYARDNGYNIAALLHCADMALYAVKESGRNNYRFYDASLTADGKKGSTSVNESK